MNEKSKKDIIAEKVQEITKTMTEHGLSCGEEIARYLRKWHPKAQVYALYRSAIAMELDEPNGAVLLYACGDPHCMGEDLTEKNLHTWEREWVIQGQRFGPELMHFIGDHIEKQIVL
jgi:hypothetical protein